MITLLTFCSNDKNEQISSVQIIDSPNSNFSNQDLKNLELEGIFSPGSNFSNADLSGSNLKKSELSGANLLGSNLENSNLTESNLLSADLSYSNLINADLTKATLTSANLDYANLSNANLKGISAQGLKLRGTDLSKTNLNDINLNGAIADDKTKWPDGFDPFENGITVVETKKYGGGGSIVYQEDLDGNWDIFIMDSETRRSEQLTDDIFYNFDPNLSYDKQKIVFVSNRDGDEEIFVMQASGSDWQTDFEDWVKLTDNDLRDTEPVWSPDQKTIAFTRLTSEGNGIFLMNSDGTNSRRLTPENISATNPSWSPEGNLIAFTTNKLDEDENTLQIMKIQTFDINSKKIEDFFPFSTDVDAKNPSFSPDGQTIAFECTPAGGTKNICAGDKTDIWNVIENDAFTTSNSTLPNWSPDSSLVIWRHINAGVSYIAQATRQGLDQKYFLGADNRAIEGSAPGNWVK